MCEDKAYRIELNSMCMGLEVMYDYSGRGMYGNTTAAIVCDELSDFDRIAERLYDETHEDFRVDNMGLGWVIY